MVDIWCITFNNVFQDIINTVKKSLLFLLYIIIIIIFYQYYYYWFIKNKYEEIDIIKYNFLYNYSILLKKM